MKDRAFIEAADVVSANRSFYDKIANVYDNVDSRRRRSQSRQPWMESVITRIKAYLQTRSADPVFLDAGAGSGFLTSHARSHFKNTMPLDLSLEMLKRIPNDGGIKINADCCRIPLMANSIDAVGGFATLHHLYDPQQFFTEAHRILKPGGILYTDHDIEASFVRRFSIPLKLYRSVFDHGPRYLKACPSATKEEYEVSEWHGLRGLDGPSLAQTAEKLGFELLEQAYHWEGMGVVAKLLERIGLTRFLVGHGKAPVIRLIVRKKIN